MTSPIPLRAVPELTAMKLMRAAARRVLPDRARHRLAARVERFAHIGLRATPRGRAALKQLGRLRDAYRGSFCAVLGNGPSLRDLDLGLLDEMPTFCLNRGYLHWRDTGRAPSFFVAVNDLVIGQFHREIATLPCPLFLPWRHRKLFQDSPNAFFFEVRWGEAFVPDARDGVCPTGTVTNAALQLAYHMGFSEVILLGIDHRFADTGTPHSAVRQRGGDINHFRGDYFGDGTLWNLPDLTRSERGYSLARAAFEVDGRRIVNATPDSALEVFERSDLAGALAAARGRHSGGRWSKVSQPEISS